MSKDNLRQLIEKYKNGELSSEQADELESKIDDFCALLELTEEGGVPEKEETSQLDELHFNNLKSKINRKLKSKFILTSIASAIGILLLAITVYFGTSRAMDSIFNPDKAETIAHGPQSIDDSFKIWRAVATIKDLTSPFGYVSNGSSKAKGFSKWEFNFWFHNYLGRSFNSREAFQIEYSLGRPKMVNIPDNVFNPFYQSDLYMSAPTDKYYSPHYEKHGFEELLKVPEGTLARAIVCFNKRMSVDEYKEFSQSFNVRYKFIDTGFPEPQDKESHTSFSPEMAKGIMLMGRPVDNNFWYNDPALIDKLAKMSDHSQEFEQLHFIASLKFMQKYDDITKLIYPKYNFDYDGIISYIENNGVYFIGVVVEGGSKELLKLKENPYVHCISVDNVVVW
jgi:hypothetical protein